MIPFSFWCDEAGEPPRLTRLAFGPLRSQPKDPKAQFAAEWR